VEEKDNPVQELAGVAHAKVGCVFQAGQVDHRILGHAEAAVYSEARAVFGTNEVKRLDFRLRVDNA
jgi:hypothetical protein